MTYGFPSNQYDTTDIEFRYKGDKRVCDRRELSRFSSKALKDKQLLYSRRCYEDKGRPGKGRTGPCIPEHTC